MSYAARIGVDLALLLGFAVPHSLLLRPSGRRLVATLVPKALFYTAYGLVSSLTLLVLYALWQPLSGWLWRVDSRAGVAVLLVANGLAWALMAWSLYHYGMLRQPGLGQWWAYMHGRRFEAQAFPTAGPFRSTRHPIYIAMFLMLWVTPWMSTGHLVVALTWTAYLIAGVLHKEIRLRRALGAAWLSYAEVVPVLPRLLPSRRAPVASVHGRQTERGET